MINSIIRKSAANFLRWLNRKFSKAYDPSDFHNSALIISPHFDDETLGCGGLIINKLNAGSDLRIAFMTDGSRSHPGLIDKDELKEIRKNEAYNAANAYGIAKEKIYMFDVEEGTLEENEKVHIER